MHLGKRRYAKPPDRERSFRKTKKGDGGAPRRISWRPSDRRWPSLLSRTSSGFRRRGSCAIGIAPGARSNVKEDDRKSFRAGKQDVAGQRSPENHPAGRNFFSFVFGSRESVSVRMLLYTSKTTNGTPSDHTNATRHILLPAAPLSVHSRTGSSCCWRRARKVTVLAGIRARHPTWIEIRSRSVCTTHLCDAGCDDERLMTNGRHG